MFKRLIRVAYRVSDIEKAKNWYRKILEAEPKFDSPFAVIFPVGDSELVLTPAAGPLSKSDETATIYWGVDDVDAAYKLLLQAGAASHTEIDTISGTRRASVVDPFGNILGIIGTTADKTKRSIEQQPSETAMIVTFYRALASLDEREEIRGGDYLAKKFLPEDRKKVIKDPATRSWLIKTGTIPGMYEYMIARTAYFDQVVERALRENIPQIVFLGAGYDSRSYRFREIIKQTRIFEVDAPTTQQRKKELLQKSGILKPEQLTFVSVNFDKDPLKEVLLRSGFDRNKKTLFIWEGVTFYLSPKAVNDTLNFVKSNSPVGSTLCFDYTFFSPHKLDGYGVHELRKTMKAHFPGEAMQFEIEEGKIGSFLSERGFTIIDHLTTEDMQAKYLSLRDGSSGGKVTEMFCFAQASVS